MPHRGATDHASLSTLNPVHVVVQHCGLVWRWRLLDLDIEVESGITERRPSARQAAEHSRIAYAKRIAYAAERNKSKIYLTRHDAALQDASWQNKSQP